MNLRAETKEAGQHPVLILCIGVLAVSASAVLIRMTSTAPLITAFYRQLFCAVLIFPFAGGEAEVQLSRSDKKLLVVSGFLLAIHFATWITSIFLTTVARATLFVDLQPAWAAILGVLFLRESMKPREIAAVAIVCVGGMIIGLGSQQEAG